MKHFIFSLLMVPLLLFPWSDVNGQTIAISGGNRTSIIVSGKGKATVETKVVEEKMTTTTTTETIVDRPPVTIVKETTTKILPLTSASGYQRIHLEYFGASWCRHCPKARKEAKEAARRLGLTLKEFDADVDRETIRRINRNRITQITSYPALFVAVDHTVNDGDRLNGWSSADEVVTKIQHSQAMAIAGGNTKSAVVQVRDPEIIQRPAPVVLQSPVQSYSRPTVNWNGVNYSAPVCNNPNCRMCNAIRAGLARYRPMVYEPEPVYPDQTSINLDDAGFEAAQEPTPDKIIADMLNLLDLDPSDKYADIGCGDGRLLIRAYEKYGCKGVGVEIDPDKAEEARQNVKRRGLSDHISIIEGDARDNDKFDPVSLKVTAASAYLYPELLQELLPKLSKIKTVASPFHEIPGLGMTQTGDVWIKKG